MAGSIARRPFRIGLLILLLAVTTGLLLILQFTCFSSGDEASIIQTGGPAETVETGGDFSPSNTPSGVQTPAPNGAGSSGTAGVGATSLFITGMSPPATGSPAPRNNNEPLPPVPGSLTGMVEGNLGAPLAGIMVYLADGNGMLTGEFTVTDTVGLFGFTDRAPGLYKLYFSDPSAAYQPGWYGAQGSPSGTAIQIDAGQATDIKHAMEPVTSPANGSITGRATSECGTPIVACEAGVADVLVMAMFVVKDNGLQMTLRGTALTDNNGYYHISNLPAGDYLVSFNPPRDDYAFQWYRGQQSFSSAEILPLSAGDTIGKVDALLMQGGTVSGTVTGDNQPLYLALVDIYDDAGVIVDSTTTGAGGQFTSSRLPEGKYRVKVRALSNDYLAEWYSDKHDFTSADPVYVVDGQQTAGINIDLAVAPVQTTAAGPPDTGSEATDITPAEVGSGGAQVEEGDVPAGGDRRTCAAGSGADDQTVCENPDPCEEGSNCGNTDEEAAAGESDGFASRPDGSDLIEDPMAIPPFEEQPPASAAPQAVTEPVL